VSSDAPVAADVELVVVADRVAVVESFALFDADVYDGERRRFDVWNSR